MSEIPRSFRRAAVFACAAIMVGCVAAPDPPPASSPVQPSTAGSVARNVILFIGDGMGVSTVTAARMSPSTVSGRVRTGSAASSSRTWFSTS